MANAVMAPDSAPSAMMLRVTMEAGPDSTMPIKKQSPFPHSLRLLRHADFERVYKQGRRHFSASLTVFYFFRPIGTDSSCSAGTPFDKLRASSAGEAVPEKSATPQGLRVGFTVSRALGGAVDRNRMKRRLREAVRLSHPPLKVSADVVINPKKSLLTTDFPAILNEVTRAFTVIEKKLPQGSEAPKSAESRKPEAGSRS